MSASESERPNEERSFVENDAGETKLPYDKGGVPIYIAIAWVVFIVVYVAVMATISLPDLKKWMAH